MRSHWPVLMSDRPTSRHQSRPYEPLRYSTGANDWLVKLADRTGRILPTMTDQTVPRSFTCDDDHEDQQQRLSVIPQLLSPSPSSHLSGRAHIRSTSTPPVAHAPPYRLTGGPYGSNSKAGNLMGNQHDMASRACHTACHTMCAKRYPKGTA